MRGLPPVPTQKHAAVRARHARSKNAFFCFLVSRRGAPGYLRHRRHFHVRLPAGPGLPKPIFATNACTRASNQLESRSSSCFSFAPPVSEEGEMTHGPGSSEDNAVEGKFSRIAFSSTIDRNHSGVLLPTRPAVTSQLSRTRLTVATPPSIRAHLCTSSLR